MAEFDDLESVQLALELIVRETPENPRARGRLPDVQATLDEIDALYHACAAAFTLDVSLPDLLAEYRWQRLPERPYDRRRARRFLPPEIYYLLREFDELGRGLPRLATSAPMEVRRLAMGSPLQVLLEVPWVYIATSPAGFWLFVKTLPSALGAAEDVILFPKRLQRKREEEDRDRIRAKREALEEEQLLSDTQRRIAERAIEERAATLELDQLAERAEHAPMQIRSAELHFPSSSTSPRQDHE
jgi:hypothetical protein